MVETEAKHENQLLQVASLKVTNTDFQIQEKVNFFSEYSSRYEIKNSYVVHFTSE